MTDIPETHETGPKIAAQIAEATKPYLRIAEVAREAGFEDQFYYSRQFRKVMNMSPTEYRKRKMIYLNDIL